MIFVNPHSGIYTSLPNFSLAYAATHFNTRVIDLNTKPLPKDRFLNYETDTLGISVMSRTYAESLRIAKEYKKRFPKTEIVSVNTGIDIQCCYPLLKFKHDLKFEKPFSDEYPFPNYELFDSFGILKKNWQLARWNYSILTSVGCPFQCIYCAARNRKWHARSAENCFHELKYAKTKWGIRIFEILDDCFNLNKERVLEFCKLVKPLNMKWSCVNGIRADLFDEDIARAMANSRCWNIGFGIESIDNEVLRNVRKGETAEQIEQAVDIAKKYFKIVNGFFIIGLPGSTYEKDLKSLEWAREKKINAHFSYYVPFDKECGKEALFYGNSAKPFSEEYLKELQEKIYNKTSFMRPERNIFKRAINKIKRINYYSSA